MILRKLQKNKGFVILFAVTISAILLSIALGVTKIAFKEIKFGTSAKDTNDAFFAADTGAECALYNNNSFIPTGPLIQCLGGPIFVSNLGSVWSFTISGLGSGRQGCAKVTVDKTVSSNTKLTSKGYNNGSVSGCNPGSNTVERQLELNY